MKRNASISARAQISAPRSPSTASLLIVDDAIVALAQPLTEAPNQLASGPFRGSDPLG